MPYFLGLYTVPNDTSVILNNQYNITSPSPKKVSNTTASIPSMTTTIKASDIYNQSSVKKSLASVNQALNKTYKYNTLNSGIINGTILSTMWTLTNLTTRDQEVYFSINFNATITNTIPNYIETSLYSPTGLLSNILQLTTSSREIDGNFVINTGGLWYLTIGINPDVNITSLSPLYYNLSLYVPANGYNFDTAIRINNVSNASQSFYNYSAKVKYETVFFVISVNANQRFLLNVTEESPFALENAQVILYRPRAEPLSPSPLLSNTAPPNGGTIALTWVPDISGDMWIEIDQGNIPGNYTIAFSVQTSGYSFASAILTIPNQTYIQWVNFTDVWQTVLYYAFYINQTDIGVNLNISEKNQGSLILNDAIVDVYSPNQNLKVLQLNERNSPITGQIMGNFTASSIGYYYIVIQLDNTIQFNTRVAYLINIHYTYPQTFHWTLASIFFSFLIIFLIPIIFLGIDLFIKPNSIEWNVLSSCENVFNAISKNPRFGKKIEVPIDTIFFERPYIGGYLLEFNGVEETETVLSLVGSKKTFLRYFYYLPLGVIAYFLINYLLFLGTNSTLFWLKVTNLIPFYFLLAICFIIIIPILAFIIFRYNFIRRLIYEINYTISDVLTNVENPNLSLNLTVLQKQLSYIRVVWNQAKKAFNEHNYSLFIIKADTAVKKLVETRYVQLIGSIGSMDFNYIIEELRARGFDIPSNKKIDYFHKIRNKVVHTSHLLLDEKTAIETFNYYNKFLSRLGMRT